MSTRELRPLNLGPDVLARLLPHRRPFLMVDRITHFAAGPEPRLRAERYISAADPIFEGHFPELHLWPGVYIQEGLGQSCGLLLTLLGLQAHYVATLRDPDEPLRALANLELGYRLHPGFQADDAASFLSAMVPPAAFMGMAASVDMKFLAPVFAGQRLDYDVRRTDVIGDMVRCDIEAFVGKDTVARGTMTSKMGVRLPGAKVPR